MMSVRTCCCAAVYQLPTTVCRESRGMQACVACCLALLGWPCRWLLPAACALLPAACWLAASHLVPLAECHSLACY